jgi:predicted metal-dependent phosphoesterase TrpH|tara:strand:- start:967 stop:1575 length:609 start_codon:yes stop_codon:yes gene_type:complete
MDPDQLIERAKFIGLDGVCITDHNQVWDADVIAGLRKKHDYLVIGGVEVSTDCGDILAFGLHQSVLKVGRATELRAMVDEAGGVMVIAHPFRSYPALVSAHAHSTTVGPSRAIDEACSRSELGIVDALEACNGQSSRDEVGFCYAVAECLSLGGTGGSDAHATLGVGACYTEFEDHVEDERDLIRQIKDGQFKAVDDRWADG